MKCQEIVRKKLTDKSEQDEVMKAQELRTEKIQVSKTPSIDKKSKANQIDKKSRANQIDKKLKCPHCDLPFSRRFRLHLHIIKYHRNSGSIDEESSSKDDDLIKTDDSSSNGNVEKSIIKSEIQDMENQNSDILYADNSLDEAHDQTSSEQKDDEKSNFKNVIIKSEKNEKLDLVSNKTITKNYCAMCDKTFSRKNNFIWHINGIHRNIKPYACTKCPSKYARKFSLKRHVKKVHIKLEKTENMALQKHFLKVKHDENSIENFKKVNKSFKKSKGGKSNFVEVTHDQTSKEEKICIKSEKLENLDLVNEKNNNNGIPGQYCTVCDKTFSKPLGLTLHINAVHKKLKPHVCIICQTKFARKHHLIRHIEFVHKNMQNVTKNEIDQENVSIDSFAEATHDQTKIDENVCEKSKIVNSTEKKEILDHDKSVNQSMSRKKCLECDKTFSHVENMSRHIDEVHRKLKPYICTICQTKFARKHRLNRHIEVVHKNMQNVTKNDKAQENISKDSFVEATHDQTEIEENSGKKSKLENSTEKNENNEILDHDESVNQSMLRKKCLECDKTFLNSNKLSRHIDEVHKNLKPYVCGKCGKKCSRKYNLMSHFKSVHGNKEIKMIVKGQNLVESSNKINENSKKIGKKFEISNNNCFKCDKKFSSQSNLKRHIESMHPKVAFPCKKCGKNFTQKYRLFLHLKNYHKKRENVTKNLGKTEKIIPDFLKIVKKEFDVVNNVENEPFTFISIDESKAQNLQKSHFESDPLNL